MSLSDRETLALNALCDAMIEGTITAADRARLETWLAESDEARRYYVKVMDQSASLTHYAGEMQLEPADASPTPWPAQTTGFGPPLVRSTGWGPLVLAATVLLAIALWINGGRGPKPVADVVPRASTEYVAQITGDNASRWSGDSAGLKPGAFLRRGESLELAEGFAEITFDSGAVVLLQGPATLKVNSAWDSTLRRGALTASVPQQAIGFRVSNSAVEVVDLGTEFSMIADDRAGAADVFVLKGEVEAAPRGPGDRDRLLLHANESRRFGPARISGAANPEQMFARFNTPVPLDRPRQSMKYAHWSFDQAKVMQAEAVGLSPAPSELKISASSGAARARAHVEGFRGRAIRFDGDLIAKARFPELSGSSPRTIAFWVKAPEGAQLSDAYSMVAWRGDSLKLAARPVHISWNRNPAEGPLGAIRTDFSGGHAMGMTPLRDGRWHHVCVIFLPGEDPAAPVQVKQYVDGGLESNTVTPGAKRSIGAKIEGGPETADVLWLGCRLGGDGPKKERFRGEIDELVIADRGLEPGEVVRLMDGLTAASE